MQKQWIIIVLVIVGGGLLLRLLLPLVSPKSATQPTSITPQNKTYTDAGNFFTVQVPSTWTANESIATSTTGLKTAHPVKQEIEISQYTLPGQLGVTVQVYKAQPTCPLQEKLTTTLAGLPAAYDDVTHLWTVPTTNATLVVGIAYPGSGGFHMPPGQIRATPVPQEQVDADKKLLDSILTTLKFNNLKPFSCPSA